MRFSGYDAPRMTPRAGRGGGGARHLMTSEDACALLGVKRPTLYSYVSRGLIQVAHEPGVKRRLYVADDVRRVAARSAARRGHAPVAAGALRWGEPVLDTSVSAVGEQGVFYRGHLVTSLVEQRVGFERVADLLWQADDGEPWTVATAVPRLSAGRPLDRMLELAAWWSFRREAPDGAGAAGRGEARAWLGAAAAALVPGAARGKGSLAARLARALGLPASASEAIDAALVLTCDHELNASTFAARIAASTGASLVACVGAALYVFTGHRHGGACDRVADLIDELPVRPVTLATRLRERVAGGASLPGFGHHLYPDGDPRSAPLLALSARHAVDLPALARMERVADAVHTQTGLRPSVDFALVALVRSLALPDAMAAGLFALGRTAGWLAHAMEQRLEPALLRPRARYVGPVPGSPSVPRLG